MEEKRRLPSWMIGASTANKASKPLDVDANDVITKEEASVVTESIKPKSKGLTRKHKREVSLPSDEKSFLVKCETKRKRRGLVEKDVIECHDHEQGILVEKRKRGRGRRKVEEPKPSRKKEEKNEFESSKENQASSCDEEDDDLTMDDVLSIAKEFVDKDRIDKGQQKSSEVQYELTTKSSYASTSMTGSHIHEETASRHESIENTTSNGTLADSRTTGDPAQDMLDLLLGPLLKKPIRKEEVSSIKDIVLPHEVKNQPNDAVISDKPIILTKKKSSLRDAVAMLLD